MNKKMNKAAQGGFTLIELIVVIVILGILAATALPKFANLGGDARAASIRAAGGALNSAASMAHGKVLVNPGSVTAGKLKVEGIDVDINATTQYPAATNAFATAAGLSSTDYLITPSAAGVTPATLTVSPVGVAAVDSCKVVYTESTDANAAPTVVTTTQNCG